MGDSTRGTITVEQIVSADGYAADPDGGLDFTEAASFGDESRTDTPQMRWLRTVDAVMLGRNTYQMFRSYWPTVDPAIDATAGPMATMPKHVVTSTLDHAPWGDGLAHVLGGDAAAAAHEMRGRYRSTVVWGSLQLTDALFDVGAVDELRLRVVPVLIGAGRPFSPAGVGLRKLRLRDVERYDTGHLTLTYTLDKVNDHG